VAKKPKKARKTNDLPYFHDFKAVKDLAGGAALWILGFTVIFTVFLMLGLTQLMKQDSVQAKFASCEGSNERRVLFAQFEAAGLDDKTDVLVFGDKAFTQSVNAKVKSAGLNSTVISYPIARRDDLNQSWDILVDVDFQVAIIQAPNLVWTSLNSDAPKQIMKAPEEAEALDFGDGLVSQAAISAFFDSVGNCAKDFRIGRSGTERFPPAFGEKDFIRPVLVQKDFEKFTSQIAQSNRPGRRVIAVLDDVDWPKGETEKRSDFVDLALRKPKLGKYGLIVKGEDVTPEQINAWVAGK
jgi:hypothetical protein